MESPTKPYDEMSVEELRVFIVHQRDLESAASHARMSAERSLANRIRDESKALVAGLQPDQRRALLEALGK